MNGQRNEWTISCWIAICLSVAVHIYINYMSKMYTLLRLTQVKSVQTLTSSVFQQQPTSISIPLKQANTETNCCPCQYTSATRLNTVHERTLWRRRAAACMAGVIENGCARNPLTLCTVPVLVHVRVWVHIPGDPQSVQLRNATTTATTTTTIWRQFSDPRDGLAIADGLVEGQCPRRGRPDHRRHQTLFPWESKGHKGHIGLDLCYKGQDWHETLQAVFLNLFTICGVSVLLQSRCWRKYPACTLLTGG